MNRENTSWFFHGHRHDEFSRPTNNHAHRALDRPCHLVQHNHGNRNTATEMLQRERKIFMSANRLKKWHSRLESIEHVRGAIKDLTMSSREKQKLYGLTTQLKIILEDLKWEMKDRLR